MRDITSTTEQLMSRPSQDVVWVLTVYWPDGAMHYAHRETAWDGETVGGRLRTAGSLRAADPSDPIRRAGWVASTLDISLAPETRERLADTDLEGLDVRWGFVLLDSAAPSLSDRVVLFFGCVHRVTVRRTCVDLECVDWLTARGGRLFDRALRPDEVPEPHSEAEGRMMPWVFGKVPNLRLMPWRAGIALSLDREVRFDDTRVWLESVDGLPPSGYVQIGDEVLRYDAVDPVERTIGAEAQPLTRPEAAHHRARSSARRRPDTGRFEWLVAGHSCRAVASVRADGLPLDAGDVSVATENWLDRDVCKVVLDRWPVSTDYSANPVTRVFRTSTDPGVWTILSESTAIDPYLAIDDEPDATAATLRMHADRLVALWQGPTDHGLRRYGELLDARVLVRIATDRRWDPSTHLRVVFERGLVRVTRDMGPLRPSVGTAGLAAFDFVLNLGLPLSVYGGWNLLDSANGDSFTVTVELDATVDPTQFFVSDIALEISWRDRLVADMAREIAANVEGCHQAGVLLENPAEIARFFLTDAQGYGLDAASMDDASFNECGALLEDIGYVFSNVLSSPQSTGSIMQRLLFESHCRLIESDGAVRLWVDRGAASLKPPDCVFDESNMLRGDDLERIRDNDHRFLREAHLHYGCDFSGERPASWRDAFLRKDLAHLPFYLSAGIELADRLQWHNHGDPTVVADLADALLSRHGNRRERVAVDAPLGAAILEPRDRVSLEDPWMPVDLEQGWMERLEVREPHLARIHAEFPIAGGVLWSHDCETFLRRAGGGRRIEFWIEGALLATLCCDGDLLLCGEIRERVPLGTVQSDPILFDNGSDRIVFAVGSAGAFDPVFALDGSGNFLVSTETAERISLETIATTDGIEVAATRFALTVSGSHPQLVFDASTSTLGIEGGAIENQRLYG